MALVLGHFGSEHSILLDVDLPAGRDSEGSNDQENAEVLLLFLCMHE